MMEIVNFKAEHLKYMHETGMADATVRPWLLPEHGPALEAHGGVFTILDNGKPVVFGGIIKYWESRGEAWLVFGQPDNQKFISIFRIIKKWIADSPLKRIEMVVKYGSEVHRKWAHMLGFTMEGEKLRQYNPDGGDVSLYSLVRN